MPGVFVYLCTHAKGRIKIMIEMISVIAEYRKANLDSIRLAAHAFAYPAPALPITMITPQRITFKAYRTKNSGLANLSLHLR